MKGFSFKTTDRGINQYLFLKKDLEDHTERLSNTLPQFVRTMFLDEPNPWVKIINRFDFLKLVAVDKDFGICESKLSSNTQLCLKIVPRSIDFKEIPINIFLQTPLTEIAGVSYNVQDFVMTLAYTGAIHMMPDGSKLQQKTIYSDLLELFPSECLNATEQISRVLIEVFDEFYNLIVGENNGVSGNKNFQPIIIQNGKMLDGVYFTKSYMQIPIRAKKDLGIRICTEIKLANFSEQNVILSYGHRENSEFTIVLTQSGKLLILKVKSKTDNKILKVELTDEELVNFIQIEVSIYNDGCIAFAVNKKLRGSDKILNKMSIVDGKLIFGSNLEGNLFGEFFQKLISCQSIDRRSNLKKLFLWGLNHPQITFVNLPYNIINRDFI